MRTRRAVVLGAASLVLGAALIVPSHAGATVPPGDTVPPTAPPSSQPTEFPQSALPPAQGPLFLVPTGCAVPTGATAVFEGDIQLLSASAARFRVRRLLAGSLEGHFVAPQTVDVRYGNDTRFLAVGPTYLVGVAPDTSRGGLKSTVREQAPLFGGDAVIGLDQTDVDCPVLEDPVRTLLSDGSAVDSGVLTVLDGKGTDMLRAILLPLAIAFLILVWLVLVKQSLWGIGRSLRAMGDGPPPARRRSHGSPHDEPLA